MDPHGLISRLESTRTSFIVLMKAGEDLSLAEEAVSSGSLFDMLQSYWTGTQRRKEWNIVQKISIYI